MTKKSVINNRRMKFWLACIYVNWDDEDGGHHDIANYGIDQGDIGQCLSWLTLDNNIEDTAEWMHKIFDYVIHDIADNYEFDKDAVGDVRYWKRATAVWRKED